MDPEKLKRMRHAALTYENPVVKAFRDMGVPGAKNKNPATQRSHGDIFLTFTDGTTRSVECQVTDQWSNFSYTAHKVDEYVGPGTPEHAYVMLGCRQERGSEKIIYVICQAVVLHQYIKDNEKRLLKTKGDDHFYVISPGELHDLPGPMGIGSSIEEVVRAFLTSGEL